MLVDQTQQYFKILIPPNLLRTKITTFQLLRHVLDSCVKLGIAKDVLEGNTWAITCISFAAIHQLPFDSFGLLLEFALQHADVKKILDQSDYNRRSCIMQAASSQPFVDSLTLLLDFCSRHTDLKSLLEQQEDAGFNCISLAASNQISAESFKVLLDSCVQHGVDMKKMLEQPDKDGCNCLIRGVLHQLPPDSLSLLLSYCSRHADMNQMMEHQDTHKWNIVMYAALHGISLDVVKIVIAHFPSKESFQLALVVKNKKRKNALDVAKQQEVKNLLRDVDCWNKCRDWCESRGMMMMSARIEQESGTRRDRD